MYIFKIILTFIYFLFPPNLIFSADVYTPLAFTDILETPLGKNWAPETLNHLNNRSHVVFIESTGTNCLQVSNAILGNLTTGDVASLQDGTSTYGEALRSMFQVLDMNISSLADNGLSNVVTIHPELGSYYAVDGDMSASGYLTVRDKSSFYFAEQDTSAYLVFSLDAETQDFVYIQAIARYVYNSESESYESDPSWSPYQWIKINPNQTIGLAGSVSEATSWTIVDANGLIDVSVSQGSDFNPQSTTWQTNSFAGYPTNPNGDLAVWDYEESPIKTNNFSNNVDEDYQNQLGNSEEADIAVSNTLDIIQQNLSNLDLSMRYSKETYITFRNALLTNTFESADLYNSKLGGNTVEHVYFTSSFDENGSYHPFMVIATHNAPSGPQFLIDVARPPGDGTPGLSYEEQTVTRNAVLEQKLVKIPLRDYGLVDDFFENDLSEYGSLAMDMNVAESDWTVDTHTSLSSTGIAVDGVIIYPSSNNVLIYATLAAEITSTGIHVGRGMGFHYHADGHGFNTNGINLYNESDYSDHYHPPLIGFIYDGVALFGKYQDNSNSMDGMNETIDDFGGHSHDDYDYHYHAHSSTVEQQAGPNTYSFKQNYLQRGAFKGNINDIPGFFNVNTNQFMDSDLKKYVGASGTSQLKIADLNDKIPDSFLIFSNYPNPFNPVTTLSYELYASGLVEVTIYDMLGNTIKNLVNEVQNYGYKKVKWNSKDNRGQLVSAGVYIYSIKLGNFNQTRKMVLLK